MWSMKKREYWGCQMEEGRSRMTQDELWLTKYKELLSFIEENQRRPSKYVPEEKDKVNWWKHQQKLLNAGRLKEDRVELFNKLLALGEQYKHVNQYQ